MSASLDAALVLRPAVAAVGWASFPRIRQKDPADDYCSEQGCSQMGGAVALDQCSVAWLRPGFRFAWHRFHVTSGVIKVSFLETSSSERRFGKIISRRGRAAPRPPTSAN
jgi:hypothetical protein